jgi:LCP family protein required for cell wall assembly
MTNDHTEILIRQALQEEANQAVDPEMVRSALRRRASSPTRSMLTVAAASLAVVVAVLTVIVTLQLTDSAGATDPATSEEDSKATYILFAGMDGADRTDSLVLVRTEPADAPRGVSLFRDSLVDIPGHGRGRLNLAFAKGRAAALASGSDPAAAERAGAEKLVATVAALTGVRADHYVLVDMAAFARISSVLGGVEVCLKATTSDPLSGANFPAGKQTISGVDALAFVRQRHGLPHGDVDRVRRQQALLAAALTRVTTMDLIDDPTAFGELLAAVRDGVRIDEGWQLADAVRQFGRAAKLELSTHPVGASVSLEGGLGLQVDPGAVRASVSRFFAGGSGDTPSNAPTSGTGSPALAAPEPPCVD